MATRLKFPRGSTQHFILTFTQDGAAIDLTGATLAAYLYGTATETTPANAVATLSLVALDATAGLATLTIAATATSGWAAPAALWWRAQATLPSTEIVVCEEHIGPVILTPYDYGWAPAPYANAVPTDGITSTLSVAGTVSYLPPAMANYILNFYSLTGLTGGTTSDLDGFAATTLANLQNGARAVLQLTAGDDEKIRLEYELGDLGADTESAPFIIVCDNAATRCWRLDRGTVSKGGQPCAYNATSGLYHRVWGVGTDGSATVSLDPTGFTIPA